MDSKERSQYKGMANKMQSPVFLKNVAIMLDALEELRDLSESLQGESMSLPRAYKLINRQIQVFQARKLNDGDYLKAACKAVDELKFKGVTLISEHQRGEKLICKEQFYQTLIDSLEARMIPDSEKPLVESMATLFSKSWTDALAPDHGESELKVVSAKFLVPYSTELKQAYRDFKDSRGSDVPPPIQRLISAVATLPVRIAACERGFSKMNIVCMFTTAQHAYYCSHVVFAVRVDGRSSSGRMESTAIRQDMDCQRPPTCQPHRMSRETHW